MKKRRTDKQRIDYIENKVNVLKQPFIVWPDNMPYPQGYFATSNEQNVRACVDFLIDVDEAGNRMIKQICRETKKWKSKKLSKR